jgi:hypothetical protein
MRRLSCLATNLVIAAGLEFAFQLGLNQGVSTAVDPYNTVNGWHPDDWHPGCHRTAERG